MEEPAQSVKMRVAELQEQAAMLTQMNSEDMSEMVATRNKLRALVMKCKIPLGEWTETVLAGPDSDSWRKLPGCFWTTVPELAWTAYQSR